MIPGQYIIVFKDPWKGKVTTEETARQALAFVNTNIESFGIAEEAVKSRYEYALRGFTATLTPEQLEDIKENPLVDFVEQDRHFNGIAGTNSVSLKTATSETVSMMSQTTPWGVTRVGGAQNGIGKKAWILDTGIDLDHPDLNVDLSNSASFVAAESADDFNGHGTHVAGIIAAKNNSIGTVGVAAGASVVAVKVCDSGGWCYTSDLKAGIDHVSSNYTSGDVANISLGWPVSGHPYIDLALSILENTIKSAADDGLLFTVAAGNSNQHANSVSPGRINYPNVYVVSAHNSNDVFAGFSNYGNPPIKYSNPGVNILSLWKNGGTETADGTSMAAPHVAGLLLAMGKEPYTINM